MDSTGIWGPWATQSFTYAVLSSVPEWDNVSFTPDPGVEGSSLTVSIDVTYFLGVESVLFEFDGTNHSLNATADTWSYTWTPDDHGNFTYTIYMQSSINTWSSTSGIIEIVEPPPLPPVDYTMLLIIAGAAVIVVVLVIVLLKKRGK